MATRKKRGGRPYTDSSVIDIDDARKERREKRQAQMEEKKRTAKKKKRAAKQAKMKIKKSLMIIMLIVVAVLAVLCFSTVKLYESKQQAQVEIGKLEDLREERDSLKNRLDTVTSQEAIEQEARDVLKMVKPGESFYVMPEGDEAAASN